VTTSDVTVEGVFLFSTSTSLFNLHPGKIEMLFSKVSMNIQPTQTNQATKQPSNQATKQTTNTTTITMPCWAETGMKNDETVDQYRERIYAMNREADLHDLRMQLFGVVYDDWELRGRYGENELEELKAEARASVLADPEYDDDYPLNEFYNDSEETGGSWNDQRDYLTWEDPDGNIIDLPEEYMDAMDEQ
jgi:hypothetical protein